MSGYHEYGDDVTPELHRHIGELEREAEEVLLTVKDLYAETVALDAAQRGTLSHGQVTAVREVIQTHGDECFRSVGFVRGVLNDYRRRLLDAYRQG
jgi:hypothetical protein